MKIFSPKNYYKAFEKYCSLSYLEYLNGSVQSRMEQKKLFLKGKIKNPIFDYPDLKKTKVFLWWKNLIRLKSSVINQEKNTVLKKTCLEKIDSKITETKLLQSILEKDDPGFLKNNLKLYGKPPRKLYDFCLNYLNKGTGVYSAEELNRLLDIFQKSTQNKIDLFAKNISSKEIFNQNKIRIILDKAIKYAGVKQWKAKISKNSRVGFILDHQRKIIVVPQGKTLVNVKLKGILSHEIGIHLLRRIQGEKIGHPLFYLGLPNYERGEEGMGTLKEMTLERKGFNSDHIIIALGICFALGYKSDSKRDFRSVFENILGLIIMFQTNLTKEEAINKAWNMCSRIFVVPHWKPEGLCLVRDYIYIDGVLRILGLMKKGGGKYLDLKIGKYDPANKKHIDIVDKLSII